jgi:hypothetical protein
MVAPRANVASIRPHTKPKTTRSMVGIPRHFTNIAPSVTPSQMIAPFARDARRLLR